MTQCEHCNRSIGDNEAVFIHTVSDSEDNNAFWLQEICFNCSKEVK